ncbi:MAG: 6-pyruvoyl-tetrahydropterin synthase-related protein, partial [Actinomycetes bacterium]
AFYGGTLYWATNLVGRITGSFEFAFSLSILASFAAAFLGTFWFARQLKVRVVLASVGGLAMITCPYFLTNIFGRGAWPEFVATAWIPLLLASIAATVKKPTVWSVALVALSTAVVSGSHVITLVYGMGFLLAVLIAVAILNRQWFRQTHGMKFAGAAFVLGVATNAWWIATTLSYGSSTVIGGLRYFVYGMEFTQLRFVLSPFLAVPSSSTTPHLHGNAPVWVLIATLIGIAITLATRQLRLRTAAVLLVGLGILITLSSSDLIWRHLPTTLLVIQFPYRTLTYTSLWVIGSWIMVGAALLRPARRPSLNITLVVSTVLVAGVVVQVLFSITQISDSHRDALSFNRDLATASATPETFYSPGDYRFTGGSTPFTRAIDVQKQCTERRCTLSDLKAGEPTQIFVPDTPFVRVVPESAYVGRSKDGFLVLTAGPNQTVIVEPTRPPIAVIGLMISILAVIATLALLAWMSLRPPTSMKATSH